jgi:hypothetical protein
LNSLSKKACVRTVGRLWALPGRSTPGLASAPPVVHLLLLLLMAGIPALLPGRRGMDARLAMVGSRMGGNARLWGPAAADPASF